jgi:hypothetical protein
MRSRIKRYEEADVIRAFAALKATRFDVSKIDPQVFLNSLEFVEAHLDGHPQAGQLYFPGTKYQSNIHFSNGK